MPQRDESIPFFCKANRRPGAATVTRMRSARSAMGMDEIMVQPSGIYYIYIYETSRIYINYVYMKLVGSLYMKLYVYICQCIMKYDESQFNYNRIRLHYFYRIFCVVKQISIVMWVKQCHGYHPPVITILIGGINHFQMGGVWLFYQQYTFVVIGI